LADAGLRAEVDRRPESVSKKIRDGELRKVPFMLVVGDREIDARSVTLRSRGKKDTEPLDLSVAIERLARESCPPQVAGQVKPWPPGAP
jgi:threonyl-tRNA synthetase